VSRPLLSTSGALFLLLIACSGGDSKRAAKADASIADSGSGVDASARPDSGTAADGARTPIEDAGTGSDAGRDPSDALFRPDHIVEVSISLDANDWAKLRNEARDFSLPQVTCASQPATETYTDFHADITVDGVTASNAAVRKKGGFGSISSVRPGLKIDVHEYVADQRIFGLKHLTLNNNHQDATLISQCLGYGLFRAAGIPASRCNFAHVVVNGEDLGVYSNVETLKKEFLSRHFEDDSGDLYESGGDFASGRVGDFQPKSDATPPDCSRLDAVVTALAAPDAELVSKLGAVVDLEQFTRYWAMEVITDHWDGYANNQNNYYFYDDPTSGKLKFIPWGIDALFSGRERTTRPQSVFACGAMAWRLYDAPKTRAMYLATLRDLLATVWDVPTILAEIDRMQKLLRPIADPTNTGDFADEIENVRSFVSTRAGELLAELDAGDPVWPYAAAESCRISIGTMSATFDTTWDTLETFGVGSGTMDGTIAGVSLTSTSVTAGAGLSDDGKPVVRLFNLLPDGRYAVVYVIVQDLVNFTPGTRDIDLANVAAIMTFYDPKTDKSSGGGLLLPGSLTLTNASTVAGESVIGSLTGEVIEL